MNVQYKLNYLFRVIVYTRIVVHKAMNSLEILRYHLIDDEFIKIFQPIIISQAFLGSARIRVKNKYISGTTSLQKLYSIFLVLATILYKLFVDLRTSNINNEHQTASTLDCLAIGQLISIYADLSIRVLSDSFLYGDCNANMYVVLQQIDRSLKLNIINGKYKNMYKNNLIGVILILSVYILILIWYFNWYGWDTILFIVFASEEIELLSFLSIIRFLYLRLSYINNFMDKKIKVKWQKYIREDEQIFSNDDVLKGFHNLAMAYYLTQKLYAIYVSYTILFNKINKYKSFCIHNFLIFRCYYYVFTYLSVI